MIKNLTLFTPADEKRCVWYFYCGFALLPILWLVNIITFQTKLDRIHRVLHTYHNITFKTGEFEEYQRVARIQRLTFWSKILFCISCFAWASWIVFYQYKITTMGQEFWDSFLGQLALLSQPIDNPYS